MKYKQVSVEIKTDSDGLKEGQFKAYASTFVDEPDAYGDVVMKGAFLETLAEWADSKNNIPVLWGHDFSDPFMNLGHVVEAEEDDYGLKVLGELDIDDNAAARQVYTLLKKRRVGKMSFAFDTLEGGAVERDGKWLYELRKLKLYEVSIVTVPANPTANILDVKDAVANGLTSEEIAALKEVAALHVSGNGKADPVSLTLSPTGDSVGESLTLDEAAKRVQVEMEFLALTGGY